jgi:hypothetical protein
MILDKILSGGQYVDPVYLKRRKNTFIIAVNCNEPGEIAFVIQLELDRGF